MSAETQPCPQPPLTRASLSRCVSDAGQAGVTFDPFLLHPAVAFILVIDDRKGCRLSAGPDHAGGLLGRYRQTVDPGSAPGMTRARRCDPPEITGIALRSARGGTFFCSTRSLFVA